MYEKSAIAITSSRLDRTVELPPAIKVQEEAITAQTIAYCQAALVAVASLVYLRLE